MSNFEDVKVFMETFGQLVKTKPQFPDEKTMKLRFDLIQEELNELEEAMKTQNLKEKEKVLLLIFIQKFTMQTDQKFSSNQQDQD